MEHSKSCMCHMCLEPAVNVKQKYLVSGFCLLPANAGIEIEASSKEEALKKARQLWNGNKQKLIDRNSFDIGAAFDWRPIAEQTKKGG